MPALPMTMGALAALACDAGVGASEPTGPPWLFAPPPNAQVSSSWSEALVDLERTDEDAGCAAGPAVSSTAALLREACVVLSPAWLADDAEASVDALDVNVDDEDKSGCAEGPNVR